jgi:rhodanese-related sulfurtransferase
MNMHLPKHLFIFLMLIGLTGCSGDRGEPGQNVRYRNVSVDVFAEMMAAKDFTLINTHIPYAGEIPGTDLLIPFNQIDRHTDRLPADKSAPIVVYCQAGPMGDVAADRLIDLGYSTVIHFKAGMDGWQAAGKPLHHRSP